MIQTRFFCISLFPLLKNNRNFSLSKEKFNLNYFKFIFTKFIFNFIIVTVSFSTYFLSRSLLLNINWDWGKQRFRKICKTTRRSQHFKRQTIVKTNNEKNTQYQRPEGFIFIQWVYTSHSQSMKILGLMKNVSNGFW